MWWFRLYKTNEAGRDKEFGRDMDTLLYSTWRTNKNLLSSTGNSAQCHVAAWMGGEFGADWIRVQVWLSPFAVCLGLSQMVISHEKK